MSVLAPIVLFVYNRPAHTQQAVAALGECQLADQSDLFVFSDGAKADEHPGRVQEVREVFSGLTGFKSVKVFRSDGNLGIETSVINGLNRMFDDHEKAIVLEDDMVVGKYYLTYMNKALEKFSRQESVYCISGYSYDLPLKRPKGSYFLPTSSNQAWGTWRSTWRSLDFEADDYKELARNRRRRWQFNAYGGLDYSSRLTDARDPGCGPEWDIRFKWIQFKNQGLTLFPSRNLVKNIGWDGSGTHCGRENPYGEDVGQIDYDESDFPAEIRFRKADYLRLVLFLYKMRVRDSYRFRIRRLRDG